MHLGRPKDKVARAPVGKEAFQAHFAQLSKSITVGVDSPQLRGVASALSRARQWAESGDYLAAIHAIGGISIQLRPEPTTRQGALASGDVEQALGDLRREIGRGGDRDGTIEAQALWAAAREEVIRGSWEAAMALIREANGWLEVPR